MLAWYPAHEHPPAHRDADALVAETEAWWHAWCGRCTYGGPWCEAVRRSLITLKALTYAPSGGIVAAYAGGALLIVVAVIAASEVARGMRHLRDGELTQRRTDCK